MRKIQKGRNVEGDMIQDSVVIKNTALDELKQSLLNNDMKETMDLIRIQTDLIGTQHPMYPNYSIGIKERNGKWVPYSKPISKKALNEMAPKLIGKFKFNDRYANYESVEDALKHSYQTQTDIDINVIELKRMLGSQVDPYQDDINTLMDSVTEWKIKHKEFPKGKPYKIWIDEEEIMFDYVILKVIEITETTILLSNMDQKIDIKFKFLFNIISEKISINISICEESKFNNKTQLQYLKFLQSAGNKGTIHILSLEEQEELANGCLDNIDYQSPFGDIESEIKFLESIITIESKYKRQIIVPTDIDEESYKNILYLAEGISKGYIEGTWQQVNTMLVIVEQDHKLIENMSEEFTKLTFEMQKSLSIFGEQYIIPKTLLHLFEAKFEDVQKLKAKLKVLDIGDSVNINLVPGENNKFTEEFCFE